MAERRDIEGTLVRRVFDAGTRAERRGFAIVEDGGAETPVHVIGDNPFESPTLRPLLGQRVCASGTMRGRTLRITAEALRSPTMTASSNDPSDAPIDPASKATPGSGGGDDLSAQSAGGTMEGK